MPESWWRNVYCLTRGEIVTYGIHLWASSIRRSTVRSRTNDNAHMHTHTCWRKEPWHKRVPRRRWGRTVIILEPLPSRSIVRSPSLRARREPLAERLTVAPFPVRQCTSFDKWRTCVNWARLSPTRATDQKWKLHFRSPIRWCWYNREHLYRSFSISH